MLGYRMFVGAANQPNLMEHVDERLDEWIKEKGWANGTATEDHPAWVATNVRAMVVRHTHTKGGVTRRHRFVQQEASGTWVSELTVHHGVTGATGWVWLDIHRPPKGPNVRVPKLARRLLERLEATDGKFVLSADPTIVDRLGTQELVQRITDPRRRGLVFVAAEDPLKQDRFVVEDTVARLTSGTIGAASAFILTGAAATEFTSTVGPHHEVAPGTLRTFLPGVVLGDRDDGLRHRFLTRQTLAASYERPGPTSRVLASRARETALTTRLPDGVLAVDALLRKKLDDLILSPAPTIAMPGPQPIQDPSRANDPAVETEGDIRATTAAPTPLDIFRRRPVVAATPEPDVVAAEPAVVDEPATAVAIPAPTDSAVEEQAASHVDVPPGTAPAVAEVTTAQDTEATAPDSTLHVVSPRPRRGARRSSTRRRSSATPLASFEIP
ncbi:hypothetical protein [Tsukamurella sp. PLM1]|uniref:hypothetical protein n=1 Tax=Tsukamurella sp. PLM1 TaxID=2929795 RepID=UPI002050A849|nr:hypothetical protein [Tsukamurella sp. PLM1]BDH57803.1 hypothetical protein MTP03_27420 [Tsukamurella sp. PLM1]